MMITEATADIPRERQVRTLRRDAVALIEINRPAVRNALDDALLIELTAEVRRLQGSSPLRALIITGVGSAFCSGHDLKAAALANAAHFANTIRLLQELSLALVYFDKPIIAALNGPAFGAGLALALTCDVRVATTNFYCATPEVCLGLTPTNGASVLLPLLIGASKARRMLLSGKRVDAQWCLSAGLVDELTTAKDLLSCSIAIAEEFAVCSPIALSATRRLLATVLKDTFTAALRAETSACLAAREADGMEGVRAFLANRTPHWLFGSSEVVSGRADQPSTISL